MLWSEIENIVGETIPPCIEKILICSGYDTLLSLKHISFDTLTQIENHVNRHLPEIVQKFDCCHESFYKQQTEFKFLPGHCDLILALSRALSNYEIQNEPKPSNQTFNMTFNLVQAVENHPNLSVILKELIKTALRNAKYEKNNAQYNDIIRYFATHIYIIGGRSCYEVLYKNLPLPSVSTVCEY